MREGQSFFLYFYKLFCPLGGLSIPVQLPGTEKTRRILNGMRRVRLSRQGTLSLYARILVRGMLYRCGAAVFRYLPSDTLAMWPLDR